MMHGTTNIKNFGNVSVVFPEVGTVKNKEEEEEEEEEEKNKSV